MIHGPPSANSGVFSYTIIGGTTMTVGGLGKDFNFGTIAAGRGGLARGIKPPP